MSKMTKEEFKKLYPDVLDQWENPEQFDKPILHKELDLTNELLNKEPPCAQ